MAAGTQMALSSGLGDSRTVSLQFASLAPRSVPAHRPHSLLLVSKHMKGLINSKTEAKRMAITENSLFSQSSPQDQRGEVMVGGGRARIQMQIYIAPKY